MSSSAISITLRENAPKALSSLFSYDTLQYPVSIALNQSHLMMAPSAHLNENVQQSHIELIVFEQLSLKQLLEMTHDCQLKLIALNKVNTRLERTSLRFTVTCHDINKARSSLTHYCLSHDIEAALVIDAPKLDMPGLLVMDMDSTTIEIECIDEIAKLAGVGEQVAEVTERAMLGELDFAQSLHQRVATLEHAPEQILDEVAINIPLMDGLETLLALLKKHQWRVAIASGGFTYFAEHLKTLLGLDAAYANSLEIINGKLTGKVVGNVVDAQVKADVLLRLQKDFNIASSQTVAMGDGANDLVMMKAAQLGVAFRAKPIVQSQADTNLNQSGLDGMVHWLG